jgi:hypothetical protein
MGDKELSNFEATIVLRKAMAMKKINLEEDPLYQDLVSAKFERDMTKYAFFGFGVSMNLLALYSFRYKTKLPWNRVLGRVCTITAFWTFFYWTSPGMRKYNQVLINISKSRKKELLHVFEP